MEKIGKLLEPVCLGGIGNKWGDKQYRQGNRVYSSNTVAMCLTSQPIGNLGGNSYLYLIAERLNMNEVKVLGQMDNTIDHTFESANRVYDKDRISQTINTCGGGGLQPKIVEVSAIRMVRTDEGKKLRKAYESGEIHHGFNEYRQAELRDDDCSNTLSTVLKDNLICERHIVAMRGRNPDNPSDRTAGSPTEQRLEPNNEGICNTLTSVQKDNMVLEISSDIDENLHKFLYLIDGNLYLIRIRKLIPKECWSLMDFLESDFISAEKVVSNSQLYKQAGNSIVKRVLMAIIGQMIPGKENNYKRL